MSSWRALVPAVAIVSGCWPALYEGSPLQGMTTSIRQVQRGVLQITILWPLGPGTDLGGYHAQLIPDSSSRVDVTVKNALDEVVGLGSVVRGVGETSKTLSIEVPYGNNFSIKAEAFPTSNGPAGNTGAIARGTGAGLNINANLVNAPAVTMGSLYVPTIGALGVNAGTAGVSGQTVTIAGTNLSVEWAANPVIKFNGTTATAFAVSSGTSLSATVPAGATVGPVTVNVDGVASTGTANFWVVSGIALAIADHTLLGQSLTGNSGFVGYNGSLDSTATTTFALAAGKTLADYPAAPVVAFTTTAVGATYVADTNPVVVTATTTAKAAPFNAPADHRTGKIRAALGNAFAESDVESIGIDTVTITPTAQTLNVVKPAAQAGLPDMGGVTYSRQFDATVNHSIPAGFPASVGIDWSLSGIGDKLTKTPQTDTPGAGTLASQITVSTDETAEAATGGKVTATAKIGTTATSNKAEADVTTTKNGQFNLEVN